jgi:predicted small lipoprotein YifL
MSRSLKIFAVLVLTAFSLTACGKRGALERPVVEGEKAPTSKSSEPKEHRGTILDGLLQ